ncbi:hypothetical protein [Subsaximicrobium wynnwilliamsii]|uniref:hypothetical protein n=1 Tax=Subsaximicrobium wynnwilliamsii TaxID=291179 RepID=UPI001675D86A|nr:hypothetical protein [Subsaximicrobium wynnwilliamsii]
MADVCLARRYRGFTRKKDGDEDEDEDEDDPVSYREKLKSNLRLSAKSAGTIVGTLAYPADFAD